MNTQSTATSAAINSQTLDGTSAASKARAWQGSKVAVIIRAHAPHGPMMQVEGILNMDHGDNSFEVCDNGRFAMFPSGHIKDFVPPDEHNPLPTIYLSVKTECDEADAT